MSDQPIEMNKTDALIVVEVQNDFCTGGKLAVEEGEQVVPVLNQWIRQAVSQNAKVIASRDWHPRQHVSFDDEYCTTSPEFAEHARMDQSQDACDDGRSGKI